MLVLVVLVSSQQSPNNAEISKSWDISWTCCLLIKGWWFSVFNLISVKLMWNSLLNSQCWCANVIFGTSFWHKNIDCRDHNFPTSGDCRSLWLKVVVELLTQGFPCYCRDRGTSWIYTWIRCKKFVPRGTLGAVWRKQVLRSLQHLNFCVSCNIAHWEGLRSGYPFPVQLDCKVWWVVHFTNMFPCDFWRFNRSDHLHPLYTGYLKLLWQTFSAYLTIGDMLEHHWRLGSWIKNALKASKRWAIINYPWSCHYLGMEVFTMRENHQNTGGSYILTESLYNDKGDSNIIWWNIVTGHCQCFSIYSFFYSWNSHQSSTCRNGSAMIHLGYFVRIFFAFRQVSDKTWNISASVASSSCLSNVLIDVIGGGQDGVVLLPSSGPRPAWLDTIPSQDESVSSISSISGFWQAWKTWK